MYLSFICFHFFKSKKCFVSPGSSGCFRIIIFIFGSRAVVCKGGVKGEEAEPPASSWQVSSQSPLPPTSQPKVWRAAKSGRVNAAGQTRKCFCLQWPINRLSFRRIKTFEEASDGRWILTTNGKIQTLPRTFPTSPKGFFFSEVEQFL